MRFFDTHLHVPTPDRAGFDRLLRHIDALGSDLVGAALILNTPEEVELVDRVARELPATIRFVPYLTTAELPADLSRDGWYKLHPTLARITRDDIPGVLERVRGLGARVRGLVVHCFPWGPELEYCVSIPLVVALARAFPELPILATHGGGYEAWALRAHAGSLRNVSYDFSVTMAYFRGTDHVRPFQRYLENKRERVLFGSDWPSAEPAPQLAECVRLAREVGVEADELEALMLANSRRFWPSTATP